MKSGQYQPTTSAPPPSFSDIYMSTQPQPQPQAANYPTPVNGGLQHQISDITATTGINNAYAVPPAPAPGAPATPGTMVRKLVNMENINAPASSGTQLVNVFSEKNAPSAASNGPQPSLQEMQLSKPVSKEKILYRWYDSHPCLIFFYNFFRIPTSRLFCRLDITKQWPRTTITKGQ